MNDKRLTAESLSDALLGIKSEEAPCVLRVHKFLGIQGYKLLQGLELSLELETCDHNEMPPGYLEEIDAIVFFPWQIADGDGNVLHDSDGTYDYWAVHKGLTGERKALFSSDDFATGTNYMLVKPQENAWRQRKTG
jgi:hypothetical protein